MNSEDSNSFRDCAQKSVLRRETACSVILLTSDRAFKFKKNVDFGFLDYSTRDKRLWALNREWAFNQNHAPDVYLEVCDDQDEPYLIMRRFDEADLLAEALKGENPPDLADFDDLGILLAQKHNQSEPNYDEPHRDNIGYVVSSNHEQFCALGNNPHWDLAKSLEVSAATQEAHRLLEGHLHQRHSDGWVRACHGDLHLGNIVFENGAFLLFDCIEFNDNLRFIDPYYDLAFILMDLSFSQKPILANRLFNAYIEESLRLSQTNHERLQVFEALKIMNLALSVRASVRAHVSGHDPVHAGIAKSYLELAHHFLVPIAPRLIAVGGLSGSGKTTLARHLGAQTPGGVGAIIIRSDVQRKRLWGLANHDRLPPEAYGDGANLALLTELLALAQSALSAGQNVIIDASFRDLAWRDAFEDLARQKSIAFEAYWLETDLELRLERSAKREMIEGRRRDASDADPAIVKSQLRIGALGSAWRILASDRGAGSFI